MMSFRCGTPVVGGGGALPPDDAVAGGGTTGLVRATPSWLLNIRNSHPKRGIPSPYAFLAGKLISRLYSKK